MSFRGASSFFGADVCKRRQHPANVDVSDPISVSGVASCQSRDSGTRRFQFAENPKRFLFIALLSEPNIQSIKHIARANTAVNSGSPLFDK